MTAICTLDAVSLPADIEWDDEGAWMPVAAVDAYTITGAIVRQVSAVQAGRPITLIARGDQHVWLEYADIQVLRTMAATNLDTAMTLTLIDGRVFTVVWAHDQKAVEFEPVEYIVSDDTGFMGARPYTLTLRLKQA